MNKLSASALSALLVLFAVVIAAQEQPPAPKPGPEHAKLAYFARKWVSEAEVKPSAFSPGGKFNSTESCEWLPGKFAILCQSEGNMMGGEYRGLSVMSYEHGRKVLHLLRDQQLGRKRVWALTRSRTSCKANKPTRNDSRILVHRLR
jgi:hypothetical protein